MSLTQVNDPPSAPHVSSFQGRFLELPTGQVLWSNDGQTHHAEVATYTPRGAPESSWLPAVSSVGATLAIGSTANAIAGTNFNGFSQGASYGDDAQMATNYPLVRITNVSTGDVCFGRTYNFSTMGVWTMGTTNALFDIPASCETGASTLQVIVNGLASPGTGVELTDQVQSVLNRAETVAQSQRPVLQRTSDVIQSVGPAGGLPGCTLIPGSCRSRR